MTRRRRLLLVGVLVGLAALGAALFWVLRPAPAANAPPERQETAGAALAPAPAANAPALAAPATTTPVPATTFARAPERDILEQQLKTSGAQFAERFGTYSNQGDFQNLIDLFPLMTERMRIQTQRVIDAARAATTTPETYAGVTTRAVTTTVASLDEPAGRATVTVAAQRATQTGNDLPVTRYETLTIEFRKQQNVWKVDGALWSTP